MPNFGWTSNSATAIIHKSHKYIFIDAVKI